MSRIKRIVNLPPAVVMANLHRVLDHPPYRLVDFGKGVFRFRVGDYARRRLHPPMEGIIRVFGKGSLSEVDADVQAIGRPPLLLVVPTVALVWTVVVPLWVWWWVRRAPDRVLGHILSSF